MFGMRSLRRLGKHSGFVETDTFMKLLAKMGDGNIIRELVMETSSGSNSLGRVFAGISRK